MSEGAMKYSTWGGQVLVWALEAMWSHGERLLASVLRGGGYCGGVDRSAADTILPSWAQDDPGRFRYVLCVI